MEISSVIGSLPDLTELQDAAAAEGERSMQRLCNDWASDSLRFDHPGEHLLVASVGERIVGIGGVCREPSGGVALRLRRFYVVPNFRDRGTGTALAQWLMNCPDSRETCFTVHAGGARAAHFWERLGFLSVDGLPYSHLRRSSAAAPCRSPCTYSAPRDH